MTLESLFLTQSSFSTEFLIILVIILIWSLIWKGFALWKAAKNNSPIWFVVLLVVNTIGILEILYLFVFSKGGKKKKK
mgnify:CR=1 FL=1